MSILDFILIVFLFCFVVMGFKGGLIRATGTLVGTVLGIFMATLVHEPLGGAVNFLFFGHRGLALAVAYLIVFVAVVKLSKLFFRLMDKAFDFFKRLPVLKKFNRLGGTILGFVNGALLAGLAVCVASGFSWGAFLGSLVGESTFASRLVEMSRWLALLLPETVRCSI